MTLVGGPLHTASSGKVTSCVPQPCTSSLNFSLYSLFPRLQGSIRLFFYLLFFSIFAFCRPQNTSQFSRGSFMTVTSDVKSSTSSHLQSLFFSPSLVHGYTWIMVASFYPSLLCWELNIELFVQRKLLKICYF